MRVVMKNLIFISLIMFFSSSCARSEGMLSGDLKYYNLSSSELLLEISINNNTQSDVEIAIPIDCKNMAAFSEFYRIEFKKNGESLYADFMWRTDDDSMFKYVIKKGTTFKCSINLYDYYMLGNIGKRELLVKPRTIKVTRDNAPITWLTLPNITVQL